MQNNIILKAVHLQFLNLNKEDVGVGVKNFQNRFVCQILHDRSWIVIFIDIILLLR